MEDKIKKIVGKPCILCGKPSVHPAAFIPTEKFPGTPQGKTRIAFYGLCASCRYKPDTLEQVEKIFQEYKNRPGIIFFK